jgi:uncharacterized protein with NRDE domain
VGIAWERVLSPLFIESPVYGTRSSTVLLIDRRDEVTFAERVFNGGGDPRTARFTFSIAVKSESLTPTPSPMRRDWKS